MWQGSLCSPPVSRSSTQSAVSRTSPSAARECHDACKAAARGPREYYTATTQHAAGEARVPLEPKSDRPIYCSECFATMRRQNGLDRPSVSGNRIRRTPFGVPLFKSVSPFIFPDYNFQEDHPMDHQRYKSAKSSKIAPSYAQVHGNRHALHGLCPCQRRDR